MTTCKPSLSVLDWPRLEHMSVVPHRDQPSTLTVVAPEEALRRASPLPSDAEMAIDGLTDDEWKAFEQALANR